MEQYNAKNYFNISNFYLSMAIIKVFEICLQYLLKKAIHSWPVKMRL